MKLLKICLTTIFSIVLILPGFSQSTYSKIEPSTFYKGKIQYHSSKSTIVVGGIEVITLRSLTVKQLIEKVVALETLIRNLPTDTISYDVTATWSSSKFNNYAIINFKKKPIFRVTQEDADIVGLKLEDYVGTIVEKLNTTLPVIAPRQFN